MTLIQNQLPKFSTIRPTTKQTLWFRPFLVKEEKKMLMILEFGSKEEIINCAKEIVSECYENIKIDSLATFEMDYLFNQLRIKSIGEMVNAKFVCPETKEEVQLNFDLKNIQIQGIEKFNNRVKINENLYFDFKCPSYDDILKINLSEVNYDYIIELASLCLIKITSKNEIIDIDDSNREDVKETIINLTSKEFKNIINFFESLPNYDYIYEYQTSDGVARQITISGIEDFFTFASAT